MKTIARLLILMLFLAACGPVTPIVPQPEVTPGVYQYQDFAYDIAWSPDESMIALTTVTGLYVYDTKTYKELFSAKRDGSWGSAFGKKYLAALDNAGVTVWAVKGFKQLFHVDGSFSAIAFNPDESVLAIAEQDKIYLVNLPDGKTRSTLDAGVDISISDIKFNTAERLIVTNPYMGNVQEWDLKEQKLVNKFQFSQPAVTLRLSQDASLVIVDYGMTGFQLWDVTTGKIQHNYGDIVSASGWQRLSGNNQFAVVWGYALADQFNSGMSVWDLDIHMKVQEFGTPFVNGDGWRNGALNADGSILAASDNQGYVYFYKVKNGSEIGKFYLPYKFVIQKG